MSFSTLFKLHSQDISSEAEVETRLLEPLFADLGYPKTSIVPKKRLPSVIGNDGSKKRTIEVDFLLLDEKNHARVVVEAKDPTKSVQDAWGQAASYALAYNKDKKEDEKIRWLLISNGHITSLYKHDSNTPSITLQLSDFVSGSPAYVSLRSYIKYLSGEIISSGGLEFRSIAPDDLNKKFKECHELIWRKQKLSPAEAFYEFCKFIFIKIREDKNRERVGHSLQPYELPLTLKWLEAQKSTSNHPVRDILFKKLREDLETTIHTQGKKRIFDKSEQFNLTAETTRELIKQFESINLSSIDDDLNGRMFEVFLNASVRGKELGQYFTPRSLVDFLTRIALFNRKDTNNLPRVIDACCGTAGFLIEVMAYLVSSLRNDTRLTENEKSQLINKIHTECLFGIEANERVARIARINMYLHGDGGSHIFHADGLDNNIQITKDMGNEKKNEIYDHQIAIKDETFDIVLTNPPFSMSYSVKNEDEKRILKQLPISDGLSNVKSGILFLQRYYNLLKPGGDMFIIIDDTVLNGTTYIDERIWLLDKFLLLGVHSMPFNAFFKAGANIKTSVLHLRKKSIDSEKQGYVFMSISNNIGHDNSLKDTFERNNLVDILNVYFEWQRTGEFEPVIKTNQDENENLECPEQIWLTPPDKISKERLDAFFYSPELVRTWDELSKLEEKGEIKKSTGRDYKLLAKISPSTRQELRNQEQTLKYIEISDVTRYGLITKHITGNIDELPSRGQYRVQTGDILMAINNSSRGTVVLVPQEFDGMICTSGFLVIRPKNEEEGLLLWYALRSEYCRKQIYYLAQTASQPELKIEAWKKHFVIPIPTEAKRDEALKICRQFHSNLSQLLDADRITI